MKITKKKRTRITKQMKQNTKQRRKEEEIKKGHLEAIMGTGYADEII